MSTFYSDEQLQHIINHIDAGVFTVDADLDVTTWNRFMATHSGITESEAIGQNIFQLFPEVPRAWVEKKIRNVFILKTNSYTSWEQRPYLFRFFHNRPVTGGIDAMRQNCTFSPIKNKDDTVEFVQITIFDYTDTAIYHQKLQTAINKLEEDKLELKELIDKLETAQNQLLQSEKLASIGQLAAGVAHEINNPIGFVYSNISTLSRYTKNLLTIVEELRKNSDHYASSEILVRNDYEFIQEDIPGLLDDCEEGLERVRKIVQDLRDFSRVDDTSTWQKADIHACLNSTLNVAANEIRHKANLVRNFDQLPEVDCLPSQLNQVFLNLIVNAAQSIREFGTITISTQLLGDWIQIVIQDSGCGISQENLGRIFNPFFTTKPVGAGTGLGLSVSYSIIKKHHGTISAESQLGQGSVFTIRLPIRQYSNDPT